MANFWHFFRNSTATPGSVRQAGHAFHIFVLGLRFFGSSESFLVNLSGRHARRSGGMNTGFRRAGRIDMGQGALTHRNRR